MMNMSIAPTPVLNEMLYYETVKHQNPNANWLLLIHGAGGSTRTWKKQRDDLSAIYHLLIVDLPGHGQSKTRVIDPEGLTYEFDFICKKIWEVVDHLKIKQVHLLGVSLGAIIAMKMQILRPLNVVSMVLAGAIVRLDLKMKVIANLSLKLALLIGFEKFYSFVAWLVLPKRNHKKSRDIFIRESRHLTDTEFRRWTGMYGEQLNSTLKQIYDHVTNIPTLFVMGAQDHFFLKQAKKYVELHKNVQLKIVEKCGHIVNLEKAEKFNEACMAFLRKLIGS